jgi:hypothetical protein
LGIGDRGSNSSALPSVSLPIWQGQGRNLGTGVGDESFLDCRGVNSRVTRLLGSSQLLQNPVTSFLVLLCQVVRLHDE